MIESTPAKVACFSRETPCVCILNELAFYINTLQRWLQFSPPIFPLTPSTTKYCNPDVGSTTGLKMQMIFKCHSAIVVVLFEHFDHRANTNFVVPALYLHVKCPRCNLSSSRPF